ncbi:MAG: NusA-like transcription termination signal-binding factor [Candidatus Heimdallarchaeum endolithica]|uniref:Probable transcription termination protein NusA n=1 Tax=Candidatus Heimdallarchaeum endolithica TaxID=2876572 RepID=A0A9Y1BPA0_9ARCH|nr:MAG: NusA-like transcription termination signal-binding factor [Candidatus Heimdallarchaeum endolithica]
MTGNGVKLSIDEMQFITIYQGIVNIKIRDCIIEESENKVLFVVEEGQAGLAIGKRGTNINKLKELIARDVEIIEYSSKPSIFIKNCFLPIIPKDVSIQNRKNGRVAVVTVDQKDIGLAIGRDGRTIKKVKQLVARQFDIVDVVIK